MALSIVTFFLRRRCRPPLRGATVAAAASTTSSRGTSRNRPYQERKEHRFTSSRVGRRGTKMEAASLAGLGGRGVVMVPHQWVIRLEQSIVVGGGELDNDDDDSDRFSLGKFQFRALRRCCICYGQWRETIPSCTAMVVAAPRRRAVPQQQREGSNEGRRRTPTVADSGEACDGPHLMR
mmetsp:Transcript_10102/g.19330  ORF Transcript_10102/g.19330 Transcript_10102/m.19330 type:complete len:179 (-) Transcript_10102:200-736(-)